MFSFLLPFAFPFYIFVFVSEYHFFKKILFVCHYYYHYFSFSAIVNLSKISRVDSSIVVSNWTYFCFIVNYQYHYHHHLHHYCHYHRHHHCHCHIFCFCFLGGCFFFFF
uniref:Uncharacterized protein n=1 Tax=Octopus bimaculoides TaxID=37653 RepID=A0A0L8HDT4_OCTBM